MRVHHDITGRYQRGQVVQLNLTAEEMRLLILSQCPTPPHGGAKLRNPGQGRWWVCPVGGEAYAFVSRIEAVIARR